MCFPLFGFVMTISGFLLEGFLRLDADEVCKVKVYSCRNRNWWDKRDDL